MATEDPITPEQPAEDPRLARLRAMQSRYVSEETLEDTVAEIPPEEEEAGFDEEGFEGFEDDEFPEDEEFAEQEPVEPEPEPELQPEPDEEASDPRLARLKALQTEFKKDDTGEATVKNEKYAVDVEAEMEAADVPINLCTRCGHGNLMHHAVCEKCGAKMPKMLSSSASDLYADGTYCENYRRFEGWTKQYLKEELEWDELHEKMSECLKRLIEHVDGIFQFSEESGYGEIAPTLNKMMLEGFDEYLSGAEMLLIHLEEGAEDEWEHDFAVMRAANDKLNTYMRKSAEYGEELRQHMTKEM